MTLSFIVGGARSGKSRRAVDLASRSGRPVTFVATAAPRDDEMAERIRRHQAGRPGAWTTVEEPLALERAIAGAGAGDFVIVDCVTLWVSNLVGHDLSDAEIEARAEQAAVVATGRAGGGAVVSNEVGLGVVPANALARRYADLLGRVNTIWADAADQSFLMVAGRALRLPDRDG